MERQLQILDEFRSLPARERLALLEALWLDAARDLEREPLSDELRALLDERLDDAQHDDSADRDWDELCSELLSRF